MVARGYAWQAGAAYLYVLRLDGASLAWEYLRRNPDYRRDWQGAGGDLARATGWGLAAFENPDLDAIQAQPLWRRQPESVACLAVAGHESAHASRFSLWRLPGRKALVQDRHGLRLTLRRSARIVQLELANDLGEGQTLAYVIAAGPHAARQWQVVRGLRTLLEQGAEGLVFAPRRRPSRIAIAHMRSLQALDGTLAGASHREVAQVIFGVRRVAEAWDPDSELRAQTRYFIRRAHAFMRRDYRRLLGLASEGDGRSCVESPFRN